ncbi:MAG: hypothetical protein LQ337_003471 [Flavoplaca oasis]|nr:MAG: hypothetical protein LQ337_003471 [Flavoplaca oasis]
MANKKEKHKVQDDERRKRQETEQNLLELDLDDMMEVNETGPDGERPVSEGPPTTEKVHKKYYAKHAVNETVQSFWVNPVAASPKIMKFNEDIKDINKKHGINILRGQIPLHEYGLHLKKIPTLGKALKENPNDEAAWADWNGLREDIKYVNQNKGLPENWTIPATFLNEKFKVQDKTYDEQARSDDEPLSIHESTRQNEGSDDMSDSDSDSGDDSIERLRRRVSKKYHIPDAGRVMAFRRCGYMGYQCLVEHDNHEGTATTYRLCPASEVGAWSKAKAKDLTQMQLGNERNTDGTFSMTPAHLKEIKWVAWQPKPGTTNTWDNLNPDNWNSPRDAPQVYCFVRYKVDGQIHEALETRTTMRRLLGRKRQLFPDYCILNKAEQQERRWLKRSKKSELKPISSKNIIKKRHISGLSTKGDTESVDYDRRVDRWVSGQQHEPAQENVMITGQHHEPAQEKVATKNAKPQKTHGKKAPSYRDSALGSDITGPSKRTAKSSVFGRSKSRLDNWDPWNPISDNSRSGKSKSGKSISGKSKSGDSNSGKSQSGKSQSGRSKSGKSTSGKSSSGKSSSGKSSSGKSQSGKSVSFAWPTVE